MVIHKLSRPAIIRLVEAICLFGILLVFAGPGLLHAEPRPPTLEPDVLHVAHDIDFRPFDFSENGRSKGFDIDVIEAAAKHLGLRVEYHALPFNEVLQWLKEGRADITPAMMHSPQRLTEWTMGDPWGESTSVICVRADSGYRRLDQLLYNPLGQSRRFAAQADTADVQLLSTKIGRELDVKTITVAKALQLLAEGEVDAVGCNREVAQHAMAEDPALQAKIRVLEKPLATTPYSVASRKGNDELVKQLTDAIQELKRTGKLEPFYQKWFLRHSDDYLEAAARFRQQLITWGICLAFAIAVGWGISIARERRLLKQRVEERTAELRASEAVFRSLCESMESVVLKTTVEGVVTYANPYASELFGYRNAELVGRSVLDTIIPATDDAGNNLRAEIRSLLDSLGKNETKAHVNENRRQNGERLWMAWSNHALQGESDEQTEILSVGNDITEIKRTEQELRAREADLSRLNGELAIARDEALAASVHKSHFLSCMSHELRTPLNGILGFADLLKGQFFGSLNEKQIRYVEQIDSCGKHLLELINDLLDMAKVDAGKLALQWEDFAAEEWVSAAVAMVSPDFRKKDLTLNIRVDKDVPLLNADRRRATQVLLNLLSNAQKYTPAGGSVEVQVTPAGTWAKVAVTDTGIGIAEEDLENVFSEFHQVDRIRDQALGGTGIGLALCRRLVAAQGGELRVMSTVGQGSSFWFTVPCRRAAELPKLPSTSDQEPVLGAGRRILVAEDNPVNLTMILDMLSIQGHEVFVAKNGQEAVDLAQASTPDLILMDVRMPVIDGLEATRRLRSKSDFAGIPIIALTASAGLDAEKTCLAAGCSAYLSKPVQSQQLFACLAEHLNRPPADSLLK
jgi:PAS domain S-box-containing protein